MAGRHFHQTARHVHGVAGRGDVLMVSATESGSDDWSEMRADLEADTMSYCRRQRLDPAFGLDAERDRALRRARGVIRRRLRQAEQDHGAVAEETRDHAAAPRHF